MVGWHHGFNGHDVEQTPGNGEGQGSLACFSPWGCKKSDTTECEQSLTRLLRTQNEEKKVSSINGTGQTRQLSHTIHKN